MEMYVVRFGGILVFPPVSKVETPGFGAQLAFGARSASALD